MKKRTLLLAALLSFTLAGCSSPAPAAADNSAELQSLKTQIEELQKENADLKAQLETTAAETTAAETTAAETTAAVQDDALPIGQAGTLKDWSITVNSAQVMDSIPDSYGSFKPDSGNKYLVVALTVTNNGKSADTFLSSFSMGEDVIAKVLYGDGYEFSATQLLGYSKSLHDQSLNPLSTKDGEIAFEIPDSVAAASDQLIFHLKAGNSVLDVKVR